LTTVFIAVAVVAGVALGLLRGGSITRLGEASFRFWPLLAVGVAVQAAAAFVTRAGVALVLLSYVVLLVYAAANYRHVGMGVVFVGIALNLLVIAANGGMPVRASAIVAAGIVDHHAEVHTLDFGSKRHLKTDDDRLTWLGDVIPVPVATEVLSFGDLVMAVGIADVLAHLLRRKATPTAREGSVSPSSG
jgi:hypothetical protein